MQDKTFYEMLGVDRKASTQEIREAYREIARVYHPDSNFYDEIIQDDTSTKAADTFKILTSAYHTLIHESKRKEYDDTLAPLLAQWDQDADERMTHKSWVDEKVTASGIFAMGTFGRVERAPSSPFTYTESNLKSVAQMMPRQNTFSGVLRRMRMILGLW